MSAIEIKKDIYWVGTIDWNVRDFHGYSTKKGTTYNSYLVMDDKITLFDTVKKGFRSSLLHKIREITDPEKIDYIVVNHVEPDHTGELPEIIKIVKPEKIICSKMGKKALLDHFHQEDWPYHPVETGDEISLGKKTISFIETRMLHWPDSMFSYLKEDKILISSDAFGQHWATSERFADEVDEHELMQHAAKYYANIILLYSSHIQKLLATVQETGLEIDMIAPDHGLIWREDPIKIVEAYDRFSKQEPVEKALIIYETMWNSTETMAKAIYDGLIKEGVSVKMMDLKFNHRSNIMTEVLDAGAVIIGSPTLNNGMMPMVGDILTYMKGLKPKNKIGAAFGSYGWSGEAVKQINNAFEEMKFDIVDDGLRIKYVPTHKTLAPCVELGRKIGKAIKSK
jgi:flavorubredoxin